MQSKPATDLAGMPTPQVVPVPVESPMSIHDLTVLLVKHYDLHEGQYDLLIEFQIGVGAVGPSPTNVSPGVMVGISKVGLSKATAVGLMTVDAAAVNPMPKIVRKRLVKK